MNGENFPPNLTPNQLRRSLQLRQLRRNFQRNQLRRNLLPPQPRRNLQPPESRRNFQQQPYMQQNAADRGWSVGEAEIALSTEKELVNKKSKLSLIVTFPDQELNKEIVTQLNPAINDVHFQQPCTPRFCYVTIEDTVNGDKVILELNKQKFGSGYITAEYKRDREEELVVNAESIDPLTLYVANLSKKITKKDIDTMFPNLISMDIGFTKKMRFTRYAFIAFKTATDALDAFTSACNKELHGKTLVVRFRRLHWNLNRPGEAKLQNAPISTDVINGPYYPNDYPLNANKKDWTLDEAEVALATEKELVNKESKLSLIVTFPDQELTKEIVAQLNPAITDVHFQQPCTPRFCHVTLEDTANAEEVICELNKQQFGSGYITAEYKRDTEEVLINAEDINPLTLYVGNLPKKATKQDIETMFPNLIRTEFGFGTKMKCTTRYAFITFKTVAHSLDAFKNAHNKELHGQSLVLKFQRLRKIAVGEAQLQNAPKSKVEYVNNVSVASTSVPSCTAVSSDESPTTSEVSNENVNE